MKREKNSEKKVNKRKVMAALLFLLGFLIAAYPLVSNWQNQYLNRQIASSYNSYVETMSEEDINAELEKAKQYNTNHTENIITESLDRHNESEMTEEYMSLLNVQNNGVMGSINIPKIGITLAVYHSVNADVLQEGAGHIPGTSLPVGGKSSHCVIAAHRGLPNAKMFTDLDRMEKGDHIYLDVLGETFAYEVDRISVIEPDDNEPFKIYPKKDLLSLVTCTPYGVNTHRLIVRAHRINYHEPRDAMAVDFPPKHIDDIVRWICVLVCLIGMLSFIRMIIGSRKKKKEEEDESLTDLAKEVNDQ